MKHLNFTNFFASLLILISFLVFYLIYFPIEIKNNFESRLGDVIDVSTEIYQKNVSSEYPIGALAWGDQKILLRNKSNEFVNGKFIIKLRNINRGNTTLDIYENQFKRESIVLAGAETKSVEVPFSLLPHDITLINIKVLNYFAYSTEAEEFPIAVLGWSFR